jgi:Nucleotidyl transferase AbiEii toxin, Type IV TA system
MAVMGGLAVAAWQHMRATHDVDLLIRIAGTDIELILERLAEAGFRPKREPPVLNLGPFQVLQVLYEPPGAYLDVQVDLLLGDSAYHQMALSRRVSLKLPDADFEVPVLMCEDLIVHKLLAGRMIDRADIAALLRANRPALDLAYLTHWVFDMGLDADFAEIWAEAFPGERPPVV